DKAPPAGPRRPYLGVVLSPAVLLTALAACAGALSTIGLNAFMANYLLERRGVSVATAGALTGLGFAFTIVGQLGGGLLSDRLAVRGKGTRPLLVALAYLSAAPLLLAI